MFLILGLVLAIPFIYLKTMGSTDPPRVSPVLTSILVAFLGTGLFTVLILDIAVYHEATPTLRERMETSAQTIKENFRDELMKAHLPGEWAIVDCFSDGLEHTRQNLQTKILLIA